MFGNQIFKGSFALEIQDSPTTLHCHCGKSDNWKSGFVGLFTAKRPLKIGATERWCGCAEILRGEKEHFTLPTDPVPDHINGVEWVETGYKNRFPTVMPLNFDVQLWALTHSNPMYHNCCMMIGYIHAPILFGKNCHSNWVNASMRFRPKKKWISQEMIEPPVEIFKCYLGGTNHFKEWRARWPFEFRE